ncbi:MAG: tRNA pseudouridine(13) synthase TruD [Gammaproteobacteria bacterium]|nr:tRNA pseudouridine(13) synthase TruD [Gammaproteobacteria bacterium]
MGQLVHPLIAHWPYAYGGPIGDADIKQRPEDFRVREQLGFDLTGQGQHAYLLLQKQSLTTEEVVRRIVKFCGVRAVDVGYAGLKDKHAITTQWFSVDLKGAQEPAWHGLEDEHLRIVEVTRHTRKLKIGALRGNAFELVLRNAALDPVTVAARIALIRAHGVPNYFGEQRFGRAGDNIERATAFFAGQYRPRSPHERGMLLSAARSWIFNEVLAERVTQRTWNEICAGDVMMLAGTHSIFPVTTLDDTLKSRVAEHDIHPTGPMWGKGELRSGGDVAALERRIGDQFPALCAGLAHWDMRQERRSLVLMVQALQVEVAKDHVQLAFSLESGAYATIVVREICQARAP